MFLRILLFPKFLRTFFFFFFFEKKIALLSVREESILFDVLPIAESCTVLFIIILTASQRRRKQAMHRKERVYNAHT